MRKLFFMTKLVFEIFKRSLLQNVSVCTLSNGVGERLGAS